jgi:hypothetical protein
MYIIKDKRIHLIFISFCVFIFVNLIENLIHYSIGKYYDKKFKIDLPSKKDWLKIIITMIIFALLQGFLTYYFNYYF